jgi:DsbC/DsbD-like thiol-disulfide interchange protein
MEGFYFAMRAKRSQNDSPQLRTPRKESGLLTQKDMTASGLELIMKETDKAMRVMTK